MDEGKKLETENGVLRGTVNMQQNLPGTVEYGLLVMTDFRQQDFYVAGEQCRFYRFKLTGNDEKSIPIELPVSDDDVEFEYLIVSSPDAEGFVNGDGLDWDKLFESKRAYSYYAVLNETSDGSGAEENYLHRSQEELICEQSGQEGGFDLYKDKDKEKDKETPAALGEASGGENVTVCIGAPVEDAKEYRNTPFDSISVGKVKVLFCLAMWYNDKADAGEELTDMDGTKGIKMPVGRSGFADIRKNGYYYVDKSGLIRDLLRTDGRQVTLITRPRRFGKTLAMSMLSEFFDIRKDSKDLFRGLLIAEEEAVCKSWMNQYPTLFLSFKSVDGLDFAKAYEKLAAVLADVYKEHIYLLEDDKLDTFNRELFCQVASGKASPGMMENSLFNLTKMMQAYYGKPVILLMDEYDVPLAKASDNGYYREMLDAMKGMLQAVKDNASLKLAVITGCLRITKESIFTGMNNLVPDTISDTGFNEYFGFTREEVDLVLKDAGLAEYEAVFREWYDGYRFGDIDVYCPWDVMNHVERLMLNPKAKPAGYWKNSSDNGIIRAFIDFAGDAITKKFETLLLLFRTGKSKRFLNRQS